MPAEQPPSDDCHGYDPAEQGHYRLDERRTNPSTDAHQQHDPDSLNELLHGELADSAATSSLIASSKVLVKQRSAKRHWLQTKRPVRATNKA